MTTAFEHFLTYDARLGDVRAMLGDPDFRDAVCMAMQALRHKVEIVVDGDLMQVMIDQVWSTHGVPSFAESFVGHEIEIEQRESWWSPTRAKLEISIPGRPGHLHGSITLTESAGVTTETFTGELKVHLPFIGRKVEGMIANLVHAGIKAEGTVGRQWLAE